VGRLTVFEDQGIEIREQRSKIIEIESFAEVWRWIQGLFPVSFFLTARLVPAGTLRDEGKRFPGWGIYPESTVTLHSRGN